MLVSVSYLFSHLFSYSSEHYADTIFPGAAGLAAILSGHLDEFKNKT